jgi:uncharacterized protein YqkB
MTLGHVAFLGSGETSLAGGRIFEALARLIPDPLRIAILETPAGFELNTSLVAGRVGDFFATRLQNYKPTIDLIPARKKGTEFSPDNPEILKPLLQANMIFMGPGSPSYLARQLQGTLTWDIIRARHRQGATLIFASAATISVGQWVLPVYEIYKVGEDVHAKNGLGFFSDFGMHLSFIPHWNNADGGVDLDTSRCFVGMERFKQWCDLLPPDNTTIGLDEHTGLIIDLEAGTCEVSGVSSVSIVRECNPEIYSSGSKFALKEIGEFQLPDPLEKDIPPSVWRMTVDVQKVEAEPPSEVLALLEQRRQARANKDFAASDHLRDEIAALGWKVKDTKEGQKLER